MKNEIFENQSLLNSINKLLQHNEFPVDILFKLVEFSLALEKQHNIYLQTKKKLMEKYADSVERLQNGRIQYNIKEKMVEFEKDMEMLGNQEILPEFEIVIPYSVLPNDLKNAMSISQLMKVMEITK